MEIELLIKELIDEIAGITWSPGEYPPDVSGIRETPCGAWKVSAGTGSATSTRRQATVETNIRISIWCADADGRALCKQSVSETFVSAGFTAELPSDAEILLDDKTTAFVTVMTFRGWIDTATYWVYAQQK